MPLHLPSSDNALSSRWRHIHQVIAAQGFSALTQAKAMH